MRKLIRWTFVAGINGIVFVGLLAGIELLCRWKYLPEPVQFPATNGVWLKYAPYVMFLAAPGGRTEWTNTFTGKSYPVHIVTNTLGFNDPHEFDYDKPYRKAANERVVLLSGGSVAWGQGSTSTATTIASRMQHYLNTMQSTVKYTVINFGMGSYIAFQQYIALELWGESFDPDWVVVMDGFNDSGVGCTYSQGVGNPMFHALTKAFITSYLLATPHPDFYRGWLENKLIQHSLAYRKLTGKRYIPDTVLFDASSKEDKEARRAIVPTKTGEARGMLAFYIKAERAILGLFPKARYIMSTQPSVNQFTGDFVNIYESPSDSAAHREAMAARDAALETYLTYHENEACATASMQSSSTYIFVKGAIELERLADKARQDGRDVSYYNVGLIFPDARAERMPYFIDSAHLTDRGADVVGRFYAEKILADTTAAAAPAPR